MSQTKLRSGKFIALVIVALLIIWKTGNLTISTAQVLPTVKFYDTVPLVIPIDTTAPILLRAQANGATRVSFEYNPNNLATGQEIPMLDDGTGGDQVAGDGIYTVTLTPAQAAQGLQTSDVFRKFIGFIKPFQGTTQGSRINTFTNVITSDIPRGTINRAAPDVQFTDNLVNIVDPTYEANRDYRKVARKFFQYFKDEYDFLNIVSAQNTIENRFHFGVQNSVRGIGIPLFDTSLDYGSGGQLLGISVFPSSTIYDGAEAGYQHETGHQWVEFLDLPAIKTGRPHWPYSSLASGIMGFSIPGSGAGGEFACTLTPEAGGVRLTPRVGPPVFTDLDLYLMGLLPPEQVGEHLIFADQSQAPSCNGQLYTAAMIKVNIGDVIAQQGARFPVATTSGKNFRIATVIVSEKSLLDENAMNYFSYFTKRAEVTTDTFVHNGFTKRTEKPFFVSTGGRATLTTKVSPIFAPTPTPTPTPVPTPTPIPVPTPNPTPTPVATPTPNPTPVPTPTPTPTPTQACDLTICFSEPDRWCNRLASSSNFRNWQVVVPGVNGGNPVLVYDFPNVVNPNVKYALGCGGGNTSAWGELTEAYVGAQLDIQSVIPYWWSKINTQRISCHLAPTGMMSVSPLPLTLSSGVTLTKDSSVGDLFNATNWVLRSGMAEDQTKLLKVFRSLNNCTKKD